MVASWGAPQIRMTLDSVELIVPPVADDVVSAVVVCHADPSYGRVMRGFYLEVRHARSGVPRVTTHHASEIAHSHHRYLSTSAASTSSNSVRLSAIASKPMMNLMSARICSL